MTIKDIEIIVIMTDIIMITVEIPNTVAGTVQLRNMMIDMIIRIIQTLIRIIITSSQPSIHLGEKMLRNRVIFNLQRLKNNSIIK